LGKLPKLICSPKTACLLSTKIAALPESPAMKSHYWQNDVAQLVAITLLLSLPFAGGCSSSSGPVNAAPTVELGNMLEPFDPPPLDLLLAEYQWTDREVTDYVEKLRGQLAAEGPPTVAA
jgi:hypothetical protein